MKGTECWQFPQQRIAWFFLFLVGLFTFPAAAGLFVSPEGVALTDPFARRQLLVTHDDHDVTRKAAYQSRDSHVAEVDPAGYVAPGHEGRTEIIVTYKGESVAVPVEVRGLQAGRPVDFATEIVPLLSRYGCNSGGCHGKQGGQNGFQLSLFGFDHAYDHDALVNHGRGRRVFPAAPDRSLLLLKATGQMPHGGGQANDAGG